MLLDELMMIYQEWDYDEKRWKAYGDYVNNSSYVRVLMADNLPEQKDSIPFGFLGPARPKSFGIIFQQEQQMLLILAQHLMALLLKNLEQLQVTLFNTKSMDSLVHLIFLSFL